MRSHSRFLNHRGTEDTEKTKDREKKKEKKE
jgi:hypothetical protein